MKGGWLMLAGMLALGACGSNGADEENAPGMGDPARSGPARPAATDLGEGVYVLSGINGSDLPGVVQQEGECRVEVVDGSLRLVAGRFAFQNRTREVCGATQPEPVMHAAGGTYRIEGGQIVLATDVGSAFGEARGAIDSTTITLRELSTEAGTETITWRLVRDDTQLVPPAGSMDGSNENAADMSTTPGVTSGG